MSFTDEDLKRLKGNSLDRHSLATFKPNWNEIEALLARLDAAEKVCSIVNGEAWTNVTEELKAWKKSAGRR